MNLILQFLSRKAFFVQNDEDVLNGARKSLAKQIFQLAYHGHISPEYASSLEVSERNYMYQLLSEQKEEEKKQQEQAQKKAKSNSSVRTPRVPRR